MKRNLYRLNHPHAAYLSLATGLGTYSDDENSEIAFLDMDQQFIKTEISPFEDYFNGIVYKFVPNYKIDAFTILYAERVVAWIVA